MHDADPLGIAAARRAADGNDTVLLRASRGADLDTTIGAFLRLDDGGPAYVLESVEGGVRVGRYSFIGTNPRAVLTVRDGVAQITRRRQDAAWLDTDHLVISEGPGSDPLAALRSFIPRRRVATLPEAPRFTGGAVGSLSYDAASSFEPSVALPHADPVGAPIAAFIESDLVIVFDHLTRTLSAVASLHSEGRDFEGRYRAAERDIFEALERTARPCAAEVVAPLRRDRPLAPFEFGDDVSLDRDAFEAAVRQVQGAISNGEVIGVVLARRRSADLPLISGMHLGGREIYRALRRISPSPYLFLVRTPGIELVGASPELLLGIDGDRLTTHPIAGTRPRGANPTDDRLAAEELSSDPKERAEHILLVDLARNDVGRVSAPGSVAVPTYMEVERYSHVMHLVSHVVGRLRPGSDALDALRAVFPAGTLSGAPKVRAMQIIAATENERRGLYGGAVGHYGYDGNLEAAITIRSAVIRQGRLHIHSGAGIVAASVPPSEFDETEHNSAALRQAVEEATIDARAAVSDDAGESA
jgi:anthranilate synthase component 1